MISLAAEIVLLATVATVFGWRSLIAYRRTGDTGWRAPARSADTAQWWCRLIMAAGFIALVAAPIGDLIGVVTRIGVLDYAAVRVVGLVLAVAAATGILAAQLAMGASWRIGVEPGEATALVTTGIFGVVRNPIFTAMIAFCVGLAAAVPNPVALGGLVLAVIGIQWQVRAIEEPHLLAIHGETYRVYTARVGRFLPGVGLHHSRHPSKA